MLNNVSCLFLSFPLITSGVNSEVIKVDWLAACIALRVVCAVFVVFLRALAYNLHSPPANGKQMPIPEEISQTLLTNKKPGNLD